VEFQLHYVLSKEEPRKIRAALQSMPSDLSDAYNNILNQIAGDSDSEGLVSRILSWIFYAKRPLRMDELLEALVIEYEDIRIDRDTLLVPAQIVEECKSLITYDEVEGIVRFTHYTVQGFLQSDQGARIILTDAVLAKSLLTYLSFDVVRSGQWWLQPSEHRLAHYAVNFWQDHVRGEGERDPDIQDMIFNLFPTSKRLLHLHPLPSSMFREWLNALAFRVPRTLLHFAATHDLRFICEILIESIGDTQPLNTSYSGAGTPCNDHFGTISSLSVYGETPLHVATRQGNIKIVEMLLDAGAEVDIQNNFKSTALHIASAECHIELIRVLLECFID
jgi:hypothetical protein